MLVDRIRRVFREFGTPLHAAVVADSLPDVQLATVWSALSGLVHGSLLLRTREKPARGGYRYLYTATPLFVTDYNKQVMARRTSDLVLQVFRDSAGMLRVRDVQRLLAFAFDFRIKRHAVVLAIQWLVAHGGLSRVHGARMATYELPSRAVPPWRRLESAMSHHGRRP